MNQMISSFWKHRQTLVGLGLISFCGFLSLVHWPQDSGLRSKDIKMYENSVVGDLSLSTGALLLDLVDPQEGEGSNEEELKQFIDHLGVPGEKAGFYSEEEHLYRIYGSPQELQRLQKSLQNHRLVEGSEAELIYSAIEQPEPLEPSKRIRERFEPNDEKFALQWHMEMIHAPEAWAINKGENVTVAVIDTGVAWKNAEGALQVPDLAGTKFSHGKTFLSNALPDGLDDHLHGTHVAGTIAQTTNNGIGVTGVAHEATIMPLKVLAGDGRGSVAGIANAIRYAADHGAQVINMSLGGPLPSRVLAKSIEYANEKGVTVVCAAGNESRSRVGYPAGHHGAIAVAAVDAMGERSWYSNWGKHLDVSAPGGDTRVDKNKDGYPDGVLQNTIKLQNPLQNEYMWLQGTSMASPHVAGIAALVVSQGVTNPQEVERIIKETADHPQNKTWDEQFGAGIANAEAATIAAKASSYTFERSGLAFFLGLLGLSGFGANHLRRARQKLVTSSLGILAGLGLSIGWFGAPLAYSLSTMSSNLLGFGSPIIFSALLPFVLVGLCLNIKPLRSFLLGLCLGFAALLLHGAIVLPTFLTALPGGPVIDRLWFALNALLLLGLGIRISQLSKQSTTP